MKSLWGVIIIGLIIFGYAEVWGEDWKGSVTELVTRFGKRFKTTSFSIDLSEFDCLKGQYKELQRTFFSQKATPLGEQSNLSWGYVNKGSIQEKLYRIVCK